MGAMTCSRPGCGAIMCDAHIDGIGYICNNCEDEFKDYLQTTGMPLTEGEIKRKLKAFMVTEKDSYTKGKEMTVDEFFSQHRNYERW